MPLCRAVWLSMVVLLVPGALLAQPAPAPSLTFEPAAVVASGVTPKGKVVWFSVAREIADFAATVVRRDQVVEDEDGDGKVRLEIGTPIPLQSVWLAVDLASGAFAVAVPEGSLAAELPLAARNRDRGGAGKPAWIEVQRQIPRARRRPPRPGSLGPDSGRRRGSRRGRRRRRLHHGLSRPHEKLGKQPCRSHPVQRARRCRRRRSEPDAVLRRNPRAAHALTGSRP